MKKITITIATLFILLVSFNTQNANAEDWRETCSAFSALAETIMKNRQEGVSMSNMMKIISNNNDAEIRSLAEDLVLAAYDTPRFSSQSYKRKAVQKFKNQTYRECAVALRD